MKDPYYVLGVSKNATNDEIKRAFRRLAKETHPDTNGGNTINPERFYEVSNAYSILVDPEKRKQYDRDSNYNNNEFKQNDVFWGNRDVFINQEIIRMYIETMLNDLSQYKKAASKAVSIGFAWLIGGIIVSISSYQVALNNGGGDYFVATGAIIFGSIQAIRGLVASGRINKVIAEVERDLWDNFDKQFYSRGQGNKEKNINQSDPNINNYNNTSRDSNSENKANTEYDSSSDNCVKDDCNTYNETRDSSVMESKTKDESNSGVIFAFIFTLVLLAGFLSGSLERSAGSKNSSISNNNLTVSNQVQEVKDEPKRIDLISNSFRLEVIKMIDYQRAKNFTIKEYKNNNLDKLTYVFRNLGYLVEGFSHYNIEELIISVAHYQKSQGLKIDGMAGPSTMSNIALNLAKKLKTGEAVNIVDMDTNTKIIYGWDVKKVDIFTYFVAYEFDYDNSKNNGWRLVPYEINLVEGTAEAVIGNLDTKYKNLGFID